MKVVNGEHAGCLVTGRVLNGGGLPPVPQLVIRPARAATVRGIVYPRTPISVGIGPDGRWEALLLPSSLVGPYRVRLGRDEYELTVPDAATAEFERIVRAL